MRNTPGPLLPFLVLCALGACGSTVPDTLPSALSEAAAMDFLGVHAGSAPGDQRRVAVIMDRHSARPGFHRVRPQLRRIQKENRLLIGHLVAHGYGLLGCELPVGPIEEAAGSASEFRIIRSRLSPVEELDEYGVYQPIRFQLLHEGRLIVEGVEDPLLYEQDKELWRAHVKALAIARRNDRPDAERLQAVEDARFALRALDQNVEVRGRAAARNLLALMDRSGRNRAILLVGGAHVPAALGALRAADCGYDVFKSEVYDKPADEKEPDED